MATISVQRNRHIKSNNQISPKEATGDNVMAELQNKLKGRGLVEPTHTPPKGHTISSSPKRIQNSETKKQPNPKPLPTTDQSVKVLQLDTTTATPAPSRIMFRRVTSPSTNTTTVQQSTGVKELARIFSARTKEHTTSVKSISSSDKELVVDKHNNSMTSMSYGHTMCSEDNMGCNEESKGSSDQSKGSSDQSKGSSNQSKGSSDQSKGSSDQSKESSDQSKGSSDQSKGSSDQIQYEGSVNYNMSTLDHSEVTNDEMKGTNYRVHHYQNVFDDEQYAKQVKPKISPVDKVAKRPMPIPRKLPSPNRHDEEIYEEMTPISKPSTGNLQVLQTEISLLESALNVPSLHKKLSKSQSQSPDITKRNTAKLQKELRKGVVTDCESQQDEEYITMEQSNEMLLSMESKVAVESTDRYLKILNDRDNVYMTMRHPSLSQETQKVKRDHVIRDHVKRDHVIRDPKVSEQLNNWKRSQGSIFAQEMIHFMDEQESLYSHVPKCESLRSSISDCDSQKYIDIQHHDNHVPPTQRYPLFPGGRQLPPPIPNRPLIGPAAPKLDVTIFTSKLPKETAEVPAPGDLTPPILPPKSESMLREQAGHATPPKKSKISEKKKLKLKHSNQSDSLIDNAKELIRALKKEALLPSKGVTVTNEQDYSSLDTTSLDAVKLQRSPTSPNVSEPTGKRSLSASPLASCDTGAKPYLTRKGVVVKRKHKQQLTRKINRQSLAIILQNRDIITEQLKLHSHSEDVGQSTKRGKETLIRSLGEILLEISELLESNNSEPQVNLVATIEQELKIKLNSSSNISSSKLEVSSLTEDVVEDVVKYFDDNCNVEDSLENEPSVMLRKKPSMLQRSLSEAMLLDATNRSQSISSLHSNPEDHYNSETSDDEDITQSVTVNATRLTRGPSIRRYTAPSNDSVASSNNSSTNGVGYFTSNGGTLSNKNSGVIIEIPPGAVMKGRRQKIWFNILQCIHKEDDDFQRSLSMSNSVSDQKSKKKEGKIQLSPIVCIGPADVVLRKPIKINIPHCVPIDANSWNLKVVGRGHNSRSDEWISLSQSSGRFIIGQSKTNFKNSTYQLHPTYARIKTKIPGFFRLVGKPASQSTAYKTVKKMVCSIYYIKQEDGLSKVKVFFVNAVLDTVESLDEYLISEGYTCIDRNIPLLCYGNLTDLHVSLTVETSQGHIPLYSQIIPFALFWKVTRIGSARAIFDLDESIIKTTKLLTLRFGQIDTEPLDVEFMLP